MPPNDRPAQSPRQWWIDFAVIAATVVAYVWLVSISLAWTLAGSFIVLAGLLTFLWRAGGRNKT